MNYGRRTQGGWGGFQKRAVCHLFINIVNLTDIPQCAILFFMNRSFLLLPLLGEKLLESRRLLRVQTTPAGLYLRCNLIWQLAASLNLNEAGRIAGPHAAAGETPFGHALR
jgi:hypothetical protein